MKISTKGRYGLRIMTDIADNQGDGCVPISDIALREHLSEKYLEQITNLLSPYKKRTGNHRAGHIDCHRGQPCSGSVCRR